MSLAGIRQRARPYLVLVDSDLRLVHYESAALALLKEFGQTSPDRLPSAVETSVRAALAHGFDEANQHHATVMPAPSLIVHISRVQGGGSNYLALLLEREKRRAPLISASRRFSFTKRERDVLLLIMRGMHASDIAAELSISQSTVNGYFKGLLRKTQARSRSEMVAKVLGWDDSDPVSASV